MSCWQGGMWDSRYSPIFRSLLRVTAQLMTLCDHAAKYMFPTGLSGTMSPAIILDKLFVAMPFPKREYRMVLCGAKVSKNPLTLHSATLSTYQWSNDYS